MTTIDSPARHPEPSLVELRDEFREANGITETQRRIEWIKLGPIPVPIPNPPARRRALRIHDLHHLVTGYRTDLPGEFQISAWECAAGLHNEPLAWIFCPSGTLGGMLRCPHLTVAAYARGRRSRTLFGQDPQTADALTLPGARDWCRASRDRDRDPRPSIRDWVGTLGWAAVGIVSVVLPPLAVAIGRTRRPPERIHTT